MARRHVTGIHGYPEGSHAESQHAETLHGQAKAANAAFVKRLADHAEQQRGNPYHKPAGSEDGGEFTSAAGAGVSSGGGANREHFERQARKVIGK